MNGGNWFTLATWPEVLFRGKAVYQPLKDGNSR